MNVLIGMLILAWPVWSVVEGTFEIAGQAIDRFVDRKLGVRQ